MPLETTAQFALGRVTAGYIYLAESEDATKRHVVKVDWLRTDLPRTAVKQDLLFALGSAMSIFAPSKNNAIARLEHLLVHGTDPGSAGVPAARLKPTKTCPDAADGASSDVDEPELAADLEQVALDQITARIAEDFAGHGLATLISAVLTADGFQCTLSPPGPDGGIDVAAGRGPLGLDSPRVLVQVKSGSQIGSPVVTQLHGVMTTHGADQGLLVAWGGPRPAAGPRAVSWPVSSRCRGVARSRHDCGGGLRLHSDGWRPGLSDPVCPADDDPPPDTRSCSALGAWTASSGWSAS